MMKFWNRQRKQDEVIEQKTAVPLSTQLHLKSVLQPKQLSLWSELFAITLSWLYQHYQTVRGNLQKGTVFECCLENVCQQLTRLNSLLATEGLWETQTNRNRVVTVFVFYRSIWGNLLKQTITIEPAAEFTQASQLLLKRIPPKVTLMLGAEYWRLYELYQALFGDLKSLMLNADLMDVLQAVFDDVMQRVDGNIQQELICKQASATIPTPIPATIVNTPTSLNMEHLKEAFKPWLHANIEGLNATYAINQCGQLFAEPMKYPGSMFITETLLNDYLQHHQITHEQQREEVHAAFGITAAIYSTEWDGMTVPLCRIEGIDYPVYSSQPIICHEGEHHVSH